MSYNFTVKDLLRKLNFAVKKTNKTNQPINLAKIQLPINIPDDEESFLYWLVEYLKKHSDHFTWKNFLDLFHKFEMTEFQIKFVMNWETERIVEYSAKNIQKFGGFLEFYINAGELKKIKTLLEFFLYKRVLFPDNEQTRDTQKKQQQSGQRRKYQKQKTSTQKNQQQRGQQMKKYQQQTQELSDEQMEKLMNGETISGWTFREQLGDGDFGTVYLACKNKDCSYAVKVGDLLDLEVKNSRICAAHDLCPRVEMVWRRSDGTPIIVTKLLKETVNDAIERFRDDNQYSRNLDKEIWKLFIKNVIIVIYMLHQQAHLVHGDIKGNNVMVDNTNKIWLIDMGLSSKIGDGDRESVDWRFRDYDWGYFGTRLYKIPIIPALNALISAYATENNIPIQKAEKFIIPNLLKLTYDQIKKIKSSWDSKGKFVIPKEFMNSAAQKQKSQQLSFIFPISSKRSPKGRKQQQHRSPRQQQRRSPRQQQRRSPRQQQTKSSIPKPARASKKKSTKPPGCSKYKRVACGDPAISPHCLWTKGKGCKNNPNF